MSTLIDMLKLFVTNWRYRKLENADRDLFVALERLNKENR